MDDSYKWYFEGSPGGQIDEYFGNTFKNGPFSQQMTILCINAAVKTHFNCIFCVFKIFREDAAF